MMHIFILFALLDDLLKIVQASDLSALSNTISAELVGFIKGIIR